MIPRRKWPNRPPSVRVVDGLDRTVDDLDPSRLAVLAGGGVSMSPPSGLPNASEFLAAFYDVCLPSGFDLSSVGLRFESVLDVVRQRFDEELRVLDLYGAAEPNANHCYLLELAKRGALVITTNFDQLIETAEAGDFRCRVRVTPEDYAEFLRDGMSDGPEIWHLHGVLTDPRTGASRRDTIVASIRDCWVSRDQFRLDASKGLAFHEALSERDLLVVGYSGSDDYDIAPALESIRSERCLVWVQHPEADGRRLTRGDLLEQDRNGDDDTWYRATCTNLLAAVVADGARAVDRVSLVVHDTGGLLSRVSGAPAQRPPGGSARLALSSYFEEWRARRLPTVAEQYLLTMRLCQIAGVDGERRRALHEALASPPQIPRGFETNVVRALMEIHTAAIEVGILDPDRIADVPGFASVLDREPVLRASHLYSVGSAHRDKGRFEESIAALKESVAIRRRVGFLADVDAAEHGLATTLFMRGFQTGDLDDAALHATRGLNAARIGRHPEGIARCLILLARIAERCAELEWEGNPDFDHPSPKRVEQLAAATEHYRSAVEAAYHSGDEGLIASTAGELGQFFYREGATHKYGEAARHLATAYRIHERDEDWPALMMVGSNLALCLAPRDPRRSVLAHGQVYKASRRVGSSDVSARALGYIKAAPAAVIDPLRVALDSDDRFVFSVVNDLVEDGVEI